MRILLLTQWFAPEPHFKGLPFARELARRGHRVSVLTGFPNYPGGKLYPGYRVRLWQRETMEGIEVLRVPLYPSHDRSAVGRVANYLSFAFSAATLGLLLAGRADVTYAYHPPATVGLPAIAFKWLRRTPCVYDVQDLWPDTLAATGMVRSRLALAMVGWWCWLVYRSADRVVVLSPGFKRRLVERGVPEGKIDVVYNWAAEQAPAGEEGTLPPDEARLLEGRFNVLFAGNMGPAQGLESVLTAAATLGKDHPSVQFVFVGGGVDVEALKRSAREAGLSNVVFLPRRHPREMRPVFSACDVLLVHLRADPLFEVTIPSKTQAYLAAGRPILMAVRGDAADLVRRAGAGIVCEPEDPGAIAAAVARLHDMPRDELAAMGEAGRRFYERELALERGVDRFESIMRGVIEGLPPTLNP